MKCINVCDLNEEKLSEFDKLTEEYSMVLHLMNLFIEVNNLDHDEVWDKANQRYDEDMTHKPNEY